MERLVANKAVGASLCQRRQRRRRGADGRGVDCVVEIGGPGTIAKSLKALAVGGYVCLIGASLSPSGRRSIPYCSAAALRGDQRRADFEAMNRAIAPHRLRPVIDRTFPFAAAKEAYRRFESRGHFGKVVVTHGCGYSSAYLPASRATTAAKAST
jgi:NADPH:quinone reductase-like Zn-dependent oxidoreductase